MKWDSKLYDSKHNFVSEYGKNLLSDLPDNPNQRILDIGCGTGTLTNELAEKYRDVLGIDGSKEMIFEARNNFPTRHFEVMDALSMSYQDEFDVVFSNAVFHWIIDHQTLVQNIYNALRPDGLLVCEFGGYGNIKTIEGGFSEAMTQVGQSYTTKFHFPTVDDFQSLLVKTGFSVDKILTYDRPTPLNDSQKGLYYWARQFFKNELDVLPPDNQELVLEKLEDFTRDELWNGTSWIADYVRLRVFAVKK